MSNPVKKITNAVTGALLSVSSVGPIDRAIRGGNEGKSNGRVDSPIATAASQAEEARRRRLRNLDNAFTRRDTFLTNLRDQDFNPQVGRASLLGN